jgi:acyl-CoA synthetase (AMP-forming)/AMP-acid ligase II
MVPLNWRLAPAELVAIVADGQIATLAAGPGFGAVAESLRVAQGISIDGAMPSWREFSAMRDEQPDTEPAAEIEPNDTALQLYTSGTTGLPKALN